MSYDEDRDPLEGGDSAPAMSFADQPIGTVHQIDVTETARSVQSRDFKTGEPAFWPANADGTPGKPKMAAVFNGVDKDGEPLSLWAPIPSDLLAKLKAAQADLGHRIGSTNNVDRIFVKLVDKVPPKGGTGKKSVYDVKIVDGGPVKPPAEPDPFGDEPPF